MGRGVEGWLNQPFTPPTGFHSVPPPFAWLCETPLQAPFLFFGRNGSIHWKPYTREGWRAMHPRGLARGNFVQGLSRGGDSGSDGGGAKACGGARAQGVEGG